MIKAIKIDNSIIIEDIKDLQAYRDTVLEQVLKWD